MINFEIAIDPEALPDGADPEQVIPKPIWSLQHLLNIALGNESEAGYCYIEFMQRKA